MSPLRVSLKAALEGVAEISGIDGLRKRLVAFGYTKTLQAREGVRAHGAGSDEGVVLEVALEVSLPQLDGLEVAFFLLGPPTKKTRCPKFTHDHGGLLRYELGESLKWPSTGNGTNRKHGWPPSRHVIDVLQRLGIPIWGVFTFATLPNGWGPTMEFYTHPIYFYVPREQTKTE